MHINKELIDICFKKYNGEFDNLNKNEKENYSWNSLAHKYGFKSGEALRKAFSRYRKDNENTNIQKQELKLNNNEIENTHNTENNDIMLNKYKENIEINKDGTQTSDKLIEMSLEQCKDVNYLLKSHGYDIKSWDLLSAKNSIWNMNSKKDGIQTLYSSKIVVKPKTEYMWNEEDIKKIFNNLKLECNKKHIKPLQYEENGKILVVPVADLHYGLLSDVYSNGNDYNLEIAEDLFLKVIYDVIENNKNKKFEKVLFVLGNDAINSDNLSSTTTKGTPQNDCTLWFTIVERITPLFVKCIDLLCKIAPVDVIYVPSNHDLHTMFGIMQTLNAWYRNTDNVNIDTSPLPRKYYKFGKNILAFSHDVKVKDALKIVSTEASNMWSDSNRVIFMLAHLHQSMEYEKQGKLELLRLPTISGYSRWSNNQGYVQSERKNQAFIIDYYTGIKNIQNTVLEL